MDDIRVGDTPQYDKQFYLDLACLAMEAYRELRATIKKAGYVPQRLETGELSLITIQSAQDPTQYPKYPKA